METTQFTRVFGSSDDICFGGAGLDRGPELEDGVTGHKDSHIVSSLSSQSCDFCDDWSSEELLNVWEKLVLTSCCVFQLRVMVQLLSAQCLTCTCS